MKKIVIKIQNEYVAIVRFEGFKSNRINGFAAKDMGNFGHLFNQEQLKVYSVIAGIHLESTLEEIIENAAYINANPKEHKGIVVEVVQGRAAIEDIVDAKERESALIIQQRDIKWDYDIVSEIATYINRVVPKSLNEGSYTDTMDIYKSSLDLISEVTLYSNKQSVNREILFSKYESLVSLVRLCEGKV